MNRTKQKIFEILITALISAGIAFLQSWLSGLTGIHTPEASPAIAGAIGAGIHGARTLNLG